MPTKKTPAQLQRDIDEALAGRHTQARQKWLSLQAGPRYRERQAAYDEMAVLGQELHTRETARGAKRSHSTMKTAEPTHRILARWESRSGKHWVELEQHDSITIANVMDPASVGGRAFTWYGYTSPGSSGSLAATTSADAIAEMEQRVKRGDFLPDAAKTPMKRVR